MSRRAPLGAMALLAVVLPACALLRSDDDVPRGWRHPSPAATAQTWRDDRPHRYLRVRADFTGDGLVDEVAFLVEMPDDRLVLVLEESRKEGTPTMHLIDDLGDIGLLESAGIDVVGPGTYRVMCEQISKKTCRDKDRKRPLELRTPAIDYFKPESGRRLLYWNPTAQQLDQAWTSD